MTPRETARTLSALEDELNRLVEQGTDLSTPVVFLSHIAAAVDSVRDARTVIASAHVARVEPDGYGYAAVCRCGWTSPLLTREDAVMALDVHLGDVKG